MSNSVFKHDLCKMVIAKMDFAITYDSTRGTESGEERFKEFANNSGVEENPPEQSRLGIFFSKEIFEGRVIRIHYAFVQDEVWICQILQEISQKRTRERMSDQEAKEIIPQPSAVNLSSTTDPYETVVARWSSRVAARSSQPSSPIRQILPAPPGLPRRPAVLVPTSSVPAVSPVRGALFPVRADLSPPPKRIRYSDSVTNLEISSEDGYESYVPREVGLGVDFEDNYEPYTEPDIDSDIQADIDECIAYADAIRARGMDDKDVVETTIEEEVGSRERHADGVVKVTYETLGVLGHGIVRVDLEVTTMTKRINALERDNTRLRGMLDVESQRVDRLQRGLSRD
ncbi:hypothetical protein Tco_0892459 [Tanacetum coccineum]|uniref:Uncharacterized protein n=1 Tax=Tanacetum coccineum TaxID=301880 RepID=A0ABQ5C7R0_9ASTR